MYRLIGIINFIIHKTEYKNTKHYTITGSSSVEILTRLLIINIYCIFENKNEN